MTGRRNALLLCCMAFLALPTDFAAADTGGRGRPKTPYRDLDDGVAQIKLERIECEMRMSNVARTIQNFEVDWPPSFLGGVKYPGMAFVDAARAQDKKDDQYAVGVFHHFEGKDPNGKTVRVEFNRVKSFEIIASDDKTVRMKLMVFPTTDAKAIARNNISYAALKGQTANVALTTPAKNEKGEELALVGLDGTFGEPCDDHDKKNAGDEIKKPIAQQMQAVRFRPAKDDKGPRVANHMSFRKLVPAAYELGFVHDDIWWAVPSVTADPSYPYRVHMKR